MGTNYYVNINVCQCCGHPEKVLHVGKSSVGWVFSLHVIPEEGLNTLEDWKPLLQESKISDEYGHGISYEEMLETITQRSFPNPHNKTKSWYKRNYAEPGPNNLIRSIIDGERIIGHGEGTWSYIRGEFS